MAVRRRFGPVAPAHKEEKEEKVQRRPAPRIGFINPRGIERAFIVLLYLTLLALVVLSVLGTFYGIGGNVAPLLSPRQIVADVGANTDRLWVAIAIQLFLTLGQYGARQMAGHDSRWWLLYLVTLGISVYYNFQAYWVPLQVLVSQPVAITAIILGDVLPEFIGIRHE